MRDIVCCDNGVSTILSNKEMSNSENRIKYLKDSIFICVIVYVYENNIESAKEN